MNLYDISVPQMLRLLGQVRVWLDKAQAHAEAKKFDPQVLLTARLAPDQWPFARQIQVITLPPRAVSAILRGEHPDVSDVEENEPTLAELRARVDAAIENLNALKPEDFQGAEDRVIPMLVMPGMAMTGLDFLRQFVLPNFYFHAVTAYAILRHNGVNLEKLDYLGELTLRPL